MESISVFLDIAKVADFRWWNADVSRTQVVCHVIYIFLDLLQVTYNSVISFIIRGYVWQILALKRPILNWVKNSFFIEQCQAINSVMFFNRILRVHIMIWESALEMLFYYIISSAFFCNQASFQSAKLGRSKLFWVEISFFTFSERDLITLNFLTY